MYLGPSLTLLAGRHCCPPSHWRVSGSKAKGRAVTVLAAVASNHHLSTRIIRFPRILYSNNRGGGFGRSGRGGDGSGGATTNIFIRQLVTAGTVTTVTAT